MTEEGAKTWIAETRTSIEWLRSEDIAEVIAFTASLPRHVNLQQLTIMPTLQA